MTRLDPAALAREQLARDKAATRRRPELFARKLARMTATPFALLRGSAQLYYDVLDRAPELCPNVGGVGWVVGDAHVENFGAFQPDSGEPVFDLNDFDEAAIGPHWLDALRLATSVLLAGREFGADGPRALGVTTEMLEAWREHASARARMPPVPREVARLLATVASRKEKDLLRGRVERARGKPRFIRGTRYLPLPEPLARAAPGALAQYVASLPKALRPRDKHLEVEDCAWRVAGTGSLGKVRIAILARGKRAPWIFDMKEQGAPAGGGRVEAPVQGAARVIAGARACVAKAPRGMGATTLGRLSMLVRRLSPVEDKLDLARVAPSDLDGLFRYLGAVLGAAHRRGATKPGRVSAADTKAVLARAITFAGLHEAAYLAYCAHARDAR